MKSYLKILVGPDADHMTPLIVSDDHDAVAAAVNILQAKARGEHRTMLPNCARLVADHPVTDASLANAITRLAEESPEGTHSPTM